MSQSGNTVDTKASGLTTEVNALRYGGGDLDPSEATGLLLALIPERARVLDVGCGNGRFSEMIREHRHAEVVGLEPHPERARAAAARGLEVIEGVFAEDVVQGLEPFDVVVFADVLEHLEDPASALRTASGLLAAGGAVIASVPNVAHWTIRVNLLRGRFDYQPIGLMDATHLRWFTQAGLERLFSSSGYHITDWNASAGTWLPDYEWRLPWRWMPPRRRAALVRRLSRRWPTVFGCQHVVRAVFRERVAADDSKGNP